MYLIGDKAFYNCIHLTDISLPESVKHIGKSAFCNCKSLKNVNLPESVNYILAPE